MFSIGTPSLVVFNSETWARYQRNPNCELTCLLRRLITTQCPTEKVHLFDESNNLTLHVEPASTLGITEEDFCGDWIKRLWRVTLHQQYRRTQEITRLYAIGLVNVDGVSMFFSAESYAPGVTLASVLRASRHDPSWVRICVQKLVDALYDIFWAINVAHLDVHPDNILLDENGKVTLVDYVGGPDSIFAPKHEYYSYPQEAVNDLTSTDETVVLVCASVPDVYSTARVVLDLFQNTTSGDCRLVHLEEMCTQVRTRCMATQYTGLEFKMMVDKACAMERRCVRFTVSLGHKSLYELPSSGLLPFLNGEELLALRSTSTRNQKSIPLVDHTFPYAISWLELTRILFPKHSTAPYKISIPELLVYGDGYNATALLESHIRAIEARFKASTHCVGLFVGYIRCVAHTYETEWYRVRGSENSRTAWVYSDAISHRVSSSMFIPCSTLIDEEEPPAQQGTKRKSTCE
jgi:hypothetical protein